MDPENNDYDHSSHHNNNSSFSSTTIATNVGPFDSDPITTPVSRPSTHTRSTSSSHHSHHSQQQQQQQHQEEIVLGTSFEQSTILTPRHTDMVIQEAYFEEPQSPSSHNNNNSRVNSGGDLRKESLMARNNQNTIVDPPSLDYIYNLNHNTVNSSPNSPSASSSNLLGGDQDGKESVHSTSTISLPNDNVHNNHNNKPKDNTNTSKNAPRQIRINDKKQNKSVKVRQTVKVKVGSEDNKLLNEHVIEAQLFKTKLFPNNTISTTQYWWWNYIPINFVPLNLYLQYRFQLHNWYFLIVMIFSLIPGVSPTNPVTSVLPVVFILGVNMLKDLVEDFKRYRKNRIDNSRTVQVIRDGQRVPIRTGKLSVGEIVFLTSEDPIPADLLVLYASNKGNKCYI